ncbi:Replication factor C subunit 4 [Venturia inaequalis]|nr:Replication factor C subunit 4 [Venturia inaequalis]
MEAISCQHESAIIIGSDQVRELENDLEARESNAESLSPTVNRDFKLGS